MKHLALLLVAVMAGCGGISPAAPSGDPREDHVLAENDRFAAILHVNVRGELTDHVYTVTASDGNGTCPAAGWYNAGVAYYWRPNLLERDLAYGTALAAHEVCHAVSFAHDAKHATCIQSLVGQ